MKTIQILNLSQLIFLIALLWLTNLNLNTVSEYVEENTKLSKLLLGHSSEVIAGNKTESTEHLLAVIQKTANSSLLGLEAIKHSVNSIQHTKNMVYGLILVQITIFAACYSVVKKPNKKQ